MIERATNTTPSVHIIHRYTKSRNEHLVNMPVYCLMKSLYVSRLSSIKSLTRVLSLAPTVSYAGTRGNEVHNRDRTRHGCKDLRGLSLEKAPDAAKEI